MSGSKTKVLIVSEGIKPERRIMDNLFSVYELSAKYEIFHYGTDVYVLFDELFFEEKPEGMDILQALKSCEKDVDKKAMLDQKFTDVLLVFDFDPHATKFEPDKIQRMAEHFADSTDMGKLYISYPMVEAFYHMKSIPDPDFNGRTATLAELSAGEYKRRVRKENRNGDYTKFAVGRSEWDEVLRQNIEKGWHILGDFSNKGLPNCRTILEKQLEKLRAEQLMHVLCTCIYYAVEYNSSNFPQRKL